MGDDELMVGVSGWERREDEVEKETETNDGGDGDL